MDDHVSYAQQLHHDDGPVVLINQFTLAPGDAGLLLEVWADDAAFMKQQPGLSLLSCTAAPPAAPPSINVAVWESARALGRAFGSPEFQARAARYPDSTVAAPHVFTKVAVPGICGA